MDDDPVPGEQKRNYFSTGVVPMSNGLQRIIRRYNESHTLLLDYCVNTICVVGVFVSGIFSTKV